MAIDKSSSEWLFFKRHPSWLRGTRFQRNFYPELIKREDGAYPGFADGLRKLALDVFSEIDDINELRMAISILSVVGTEEDIPSIENLHKMRNEELSTDIKTCVYEIRHASKDE